LILKESSKKYSSEGDGFYLSRLFDGCFPKH
jgi:hypothetical protein